MVEYLKLVLRTVQCLRANIIAYNSNNVNNCLWEAEPCLFCVNPCEGKRQSNGKLKVSDSLQP